VTDPVQQAREALDVYSDVPEAVYVSPAVKALRDLLAHVEALEEERARLIDPADLEALGYCDLQYRGVRSGDYAWGLKVYSQSSTHYAASAAEAIRAAQGVQDA
jgi:hypothetical protein